MGDNKLIELLEKNGLKRVEARALSVFMDGRQRTAVEIERDGGLRQPDVSLSMCSMLRRGWFRLEYVKKDAKEKGRPFYVYHLAKTFPEIITDLTTERSQEIAGMMADLNALRAVA